MRYRSPKQKEADRVFAAEKATADHKAEENAVAAKTTRLRALRLARDSALAIPTPQPVPTKRWGKA